VTSRLEKGQSLTFFTVLSNENNGKVVTSEKIGGSGVTSTQGTWYGGVVMGVHFPLIRPPSCIEISTVRRHKSKI
jgi:hypothetical protein